MMENPQLDQNLQDLIYSEFQKLSLRDKLIVYAKLIHPTTFKITSNDIIGLDKELVTEVFESFCNNIRNN